MASFTTLFSECERPYTGLELRPHFLLSELGLRGSGIAGFRGPCRVDTESLVDWEDRMENDHIEAASMVHFIGEFFGASLKEGVLIQRLFMALALELLTERKVAARRSGDDLFVNDRKLSVSIVTACPVSQLMHVGINIDPAGAPVAAIGLAELGMTPLECKEWSKALLARFTEEWEGMEWACVKVRPVM
jgi:hypothetical protein